MIANDIQRGCSGRLVIGKAVLYITTRCTLNCEKCGAFIPHFSEHHDTPVGDVLGDINALLSAVDYIWNLGIAGGEPFMCKHLGPTIMAAADSRKIGDINIVTNGTIIPDENVILALRHPKVRVQISSYPKELQKNADNLCALLVANGIRCEHTGYQPWKDYGDFSRINDSGAAKRFALCINSLTNNVYEGKYNVCCLSPMAMAAGVIPECPDDFVDLRCGDTAKIREGLKKMRKKRVITACQYCYGDTYMTPTIPPAAQAKRKTTEAEQ